MKDIDYIRRILDVLNDARKSVADSGNRLSPFLQPVVEETSVELRELIDRWRHNLDHIEGEPEAVEEVDARTEIMLADIRMVRERNRTKWSRPHRNKKKVGICLHHTAIAGGMAGPRTLPSAEEARWLSRLLPKAANRAIHDDLRRLAYRIAGQGPHYHGQSYHVWSTRMHGGLIFNLPFDSRTWHGDGANDDYLGYAIDYHSGKEKLWDIDLERRKLKHTISAARDEGHPIELLTVHGAWANKPIDPGAEVIREVMKPVAKDWGLHINYDVKRPGCTSIREMLEVG